MAFRRATAAKWALTDTVNGCAQLKIALSVQTGSRLWPAASKTVDLEIPTATAIETCRTLIQMALLSFVWELLPPLLRHERLAAEAPHSDDKLRRLLASACSPCYP